MIDFQIKSLCFLTSVALAAVVATGCATQPRVVEVSSSTRTWTINTADRNLYLRDRASDFRAELSPLPLADQRQEFFVKWVPRGVEQVKFEYRQVNAPNKISESTIASKGRHTAIFKVAGEDFHTAGPVSAWRVSLWKADQLLAEKTSALW